MSDLEMTHSHSFQATREKALKAVVIYIFQLRANLNNRIRSTSAESEEMK